jgi:hypothetical protein
MEPDRPSHPPGKDAHLCEGALQLFLAQSVTKSTLDLERLWNLTGPLILQVKMLICTPYFLSKPTPRSEKIYVKLAVL